MSIKRVLVAAITAVLLAGCASGPPTTVTEVVTATVTKESSRAEKPKANGLFTNEGVGVS